MKLATHRNQFANQHRPGGFTLVELLVVCTIIAILAAILVPVVGKARLKGKITRSQLDLQTLMKGVTAFKADTGDIPRSNGVFHDNGYQANLNVTAGGQGTHSYGGAYILCAALLAPGPATLSDVQVYSATADYHEGDLVRMSGDPLKVATRPFCWGALVNHPKTAPPDPGPYNCTAEWAFLAQSNRANPDAGPVDGLTGPGFRITPGGKVYGPYVQPGALRVRGMFFCNGDGLPIMYLTSLRNPDLAVTDPLGFCTKTKGNSTNPLWSADENFQFTPYADASYTPVGATCWTDLTNMKEEQKLTWLTGNAFNMFMGDLNANGQIDAGESPIFSGPFFLWAASPRTVHFGPGELFSTGTTTPAPGNVKDMQLLQNVDDVISFRP